MDTNLFIYAFEFTKSNSRKVINLLNEGEIEGIISECVFKEVQNYFKKYYSKDLVGVFRDYLITSCIIIPSSEVEGEMRKYRGKIKNKDLEQLAVTKKFGLKFLVSYDRDFEPFEEYRTPKEFIKELGLEPEEEEF